MKRGEKSKQYRPAVFIVVYRKNRKKIKYLLLERKLHWSGWEFPKGGIEKNETPLQAVIREVKEETGISPKNIQLQNYLGNYDYDRKSMKDRKPYAGQTFVLFSAEVLNTNVKIDSKEHKSYKWVEFKEAKETLTWIDQKNSISIVNKFLREK